MSTNSYIVKKECKRCRGMGCFFTGNFPGATADCGYCRGMGYEETEIQEIKVSQKCETHVYGLTSNINEEMITLGPEEDITPPYNYICKFCPECGYELDIANRR